MFFGVRWFLLDFFFHIFYFICIIFILFYFIFNIHEEYLLS